MSASHQSQSATFSNYKCYNTTKVSTGILPSGAVSFASYLHAGRNSDK